MNYYYTIKDPPILKISLIYLNESPTAYRDAEDMVPVTSYQTPLYALMNIHPDRVLLFSQKNVIFYPISGKCFWFAHLPESLMVVVKDTIV